MIECKLIVSFLVEGTNIILEEPPTINLQSEVYNYQSKVSCILQNVKFLERMSYNRFPWFLQETLSACDSKATMEVIFLNNSHSYNMNL